MGTFTVARNHLVTTQTENFSLSRHRKLCKNVSQYEERYDLDMTHLIGNGTHAYISGAISCSSCAKFESHFSLAL